MKVRFWGTRGSIPRPAGRFLRYGGNTACVEVRTGSGACIVIDCGTGAVDLGAALCREGRAKRGALLISHTHWDHIQGLPFFAPFFMPGAEWDVYAPRGIARSLRETLAGQMQHAYFPITLDELAAGIRYHELVEGVFEYAGVRVSTHYLDHPALTLGYRLEADGATLVHASDHEPISRQAIPSGRELRGAERAHVAFLRDADFVIHDAQFTAAEYPAKIGWGHSTPDYAAAVCIAAGARRLALTHHDPGRGDDDVDAMLAALSERLGGAGATLEVTGAAEGQSVELGGAAQPGAGKGAAQEATRPVQADTARHRLVVCGLPAEAEGVVRSAATAEALPVRAEGGFGKAVREALTDGRATILLDAALAADHAAEIARLQGAGAAGDAPAQVVVVAGRDAGQESADGVAADRLVWPFSEQYARARIRAAVLRAECRWCAAPVPENEVERLRDLDALGILDTAREERFDRIARLAARALGTPAALITLIGADRQWFKSCIGLEGSETSREEAFCAHAIVEPEPLVVSDALEDLRFADNPIVTGGPRVRFYAGCPIRAPSGLPLGSLCVVDSKPREIGDEQVALLKDLAALVEQEFASLGRR